jgi:hypothetical protein
MAGQAPNPWGSVVPQCMHFRFDLPRDLFARSVLKSLRRSSRLSSLGLVDGVAFLGVLRRRVPDRPQLFAISPPSVGPSRRDLSGRCWGRGGGCLSGDVTPFGVFLRLVDPPRFFTGLPLVTGRTMVVGIGSTTGLWAHFNDGVVVVLRIGSTPEIELVGGVVMPSKSISGMLRVYSSLSASCLLLFLITGPSGQSLCL